MFRSLASSLITLFAVLLFAFTMLFVFTGSAGVKFSRNELTGDIATSVLIAQEMAKAKKEAEAVDVGFEPDMTDEPEEGAKGGGDKVVLWVSIPGLRTDYIDKAEAPFLEEMSNDGSSTMKLKPNFPCVLAPAHATLATGTTVDQHGIMMNKVRLEDGSIVDADGPQLAAEPIWTTATRQGLRVLVHDWPLSFTQPAENAAAYSNSSFDASLTDEQRLNALYDTWSSDKDEKKLRLLMCRLDDIKKGGLEHGPRADETYAVVAKTDKAVKAFIDKVKENWATLAAPNAELAVLVTTDHGMIELEKNINLTKLLGPDTMKNVDLISHDAVAQLYFKNLPDSEGEVKLFEKEFDDAMSKRLYFRTFSQADLPAEWKFPFEGRTGDRILVLKSGYGFSDYEAEEPVFDPALSDTPHFSGFGYPVEDAFRMTGQSFLWGFPNQPAYGDMGEIDQTVFHGTVCKLLGIEPSEKASTTTVSVN